MALGNALLDVDDALAPSEAEFAADAEDGLIELIHASGYDFDALGRDPRYHALRAALHGSRDRRRSIEFPRRRPRVMARVAPRARTPRRRVRVRSASASRDGPDSEPGSQPDRPPVARRRAGCPAFEDVLANVRPGRVVYALTTKEQERALRDADGRIALDVLRHFLGARPANSDRFSLTEFAFQAVARRLGYVVGQKRCRAMVRRLVAEGVISEAGHYRQTYRNSGVRSGFLVALYALARWASAPTQRDVGNRPRVKAKTRRRCWQHPLFGDIQGLPPPEWDAAKRRSSRSLDEVFGRSAEAVVARRTEGRLA